MIPVPPGALILLIGAPGAGKSTLAAQLVAAGVVAGDDVLSTDELREELAGSAEDLTVERKVFAELRRRLIPRMEVGRTTVVDATSLWPRRRARHISVAKAAGRPVVAVVLDVPVATLLARNAGRNRRVPGGGVVLMSRQAAALTDETLLAEGCDVVVRVADPGAPAHPDGGTGEQGRNAQ